MRPALAVMVFSMVLGLSSPAMAQEPTSGGSDAAAQIAGGPQGQVGLDLGFFSGSVGIGDVFVMSPEFWGWYAFTENIAVSLRWGMPYGSWSESTIEESGFHPGNPFAAAWYVLSQPNLHVRVGAGVAVPLANIPDDNVRHAALASQTYSTAIAMRGAWNVWLHVPEELSVVVPGRMDYTLSPNIVLGADLGLAMVLSTSDGGLAFFNNDSNAVIQFGGDVAYRAGMIDAGIAVRGVWFPTIDGDKFQLSTEPFVRADFGAAFANLRMVINIDEPSGFSFSEDEVWGLFLGGGANL